MKANQLTLQHLGIGQLAKQVDNTTKNQKKTEGKKGSSFANKKRRQGPILLRPKPFHLMPLTTLRAREREHTHARTGVCKSLFVYPCIFMCVYVEVDVYLCVRAYVYVDSYMYVYLCVHVYLYVDSYIRVNVCTHRCIYVCTHVSIHIQID